MNEIDELRAENLELKLTVARLERYIGELREGLDALLHPAPSELLAQNSAHPSRRKTNLHKPDPRRLPVPDWYVK
jgi:hypothetical protein